MKKKIVFLLALVLGIISSVNNILIACPNCKDAFEKGSVEASIGEGFSLSVIFMLTMFFSVFIGFSAKIYFTMKKRNASSHYFDV
ncbi:MAG: hypothetical protein HYZ54_04720 [Ignavibacteriae bacterium]|nr:hypothetical protein [Ignavibacteriota bacterium]